MNGPQDTPRDRQRPISARRGGPATFAGTEYQILIATAEALALLPYCISKPNISHRVSMEFRVVIGALQVGFDIRTAGVGERLLEVKLNPTPDEIVQWLEDVRCAAPGVDDDATFYFVYERRSVASTELETLVGIAVEAEDDSQFHARRPRGPRVEAMLKALGPDARPLLRRMICSHRPSGAEERVSALNAGAQTTHDGASEALIGLLNERLHDAATHRGTVELADIAEEMRIRSMPLTVPAGQSGSGLDPMIRAALAVATHCPTPLPLDVLAQALGTNANQLRSDIEPLVDSVPLDEQPSLIAPALAHTVDHPDITELKRRVLASLLSAGELPEWRDAIRQQLTNAVALSEAVIEIDPELVAGLFVRVEKQFKTAGDFHLTLRAAQLAINASFRSSGPSGITDQMVRYRAQTQICGVSWVYQRTGNLESADHYAQESLKLGRDVGWEVNNAYCLKCLGRLRRLQAERSESDERERLFTESARYLVDARVAFEALTDFGPAHQEVGDCRSLLGRTFLAMGRRRDAAVEVTAALEILEGFPGEKDWADVTLLDAELAVLDGEILAAGHRVDEVLGYFGLGSDPGEATEIAARALIMRGQLRNRRNQGAAAAADFDNAASCYQRLFDPENAARASLMAKEQRDEIPAAIADRVRAVRPLVAVAAIELYESEMAPRAGVRAQRQGMSTASITRLMESAEQIARRREVQWE